MRIGSRDGSRAVDRGPHPGACRSGVVVALGDAVLCVVGVVRRPAAVASSLGMLGAFRWIGQRSRGFPGGWTAASCRPSAVGVGAEGFATRPRWVRRRVRRPTSARGPSPPPWHTWAAPARPAPAEPGSPPRPPPAGPARRAGPRRRALRFPPVAAVPQPVCPAGGGPRRARPRRQVGSGGAVRAAVRHPTVPAASPVPGGHARAPPGARVRRTSCPPSGEAPPRSPPRGHPSTLSKTAPSAASGARSSSLRGARRPATALVTFSAACRACARADSNCRQAAPDPSPHRSRALSDAVAVLSWMPGWRVPAPRERGFPCWPVGDGSARRSTVRLLRTGGFVVFRLLGRRGEARVRLHDGPRRGTDSGEPCRLLVVPSPRTSPGPPPRQGCGRRRRRRCTTRTPWPGQASLPHRVTGSETVSPSCATTNSPDLIHHCDREFLDPACAGVLPCLTPQPGEDVPAQGLLARRGAAMRMPRLTSNSCRALGGRELKASSTMPTVRSFRAATAGCVQGVERSGQAFEVLDRDALRGPTAAP